MEKRSIEFINWLIRQEITLYLRDKKVRNWRITSSEVRKVQVLFKSDSMAVKGRDVIKCHCDGKTFNMGANSAEVAFEGRVVTVNIH